MFWVGRLPAALFLMCERLLTSDYDVRDGGRERRNLIDSCRSGTRAVTQFRPFSAAETRPGTGRSFIAVAAADDGRSIARGDAYLLGWRYGNAATHSRLGDVRRRGVDQADDRRIRRLCPR